MQHFQELDPASIFWDIVKPGACTPAVREAFCEATAENVQDFKGLCTCGPAVFEVFREEQL